MVSLSLMYHDLQPHLTLQAVSSLCRAAARLPPHAGLPLLLQAVAENKQAGSPPVAHNPPMDIYQRLASELDTEGRYLFLNALANQLRYPNNHTHHFSCVLLYLFEKAQQVGNPVSGLPSDGVHMLLVQGLLWGCSQGGAAPQGPWPASSRSAGWPPSCCCLFLYLSGEA